MTNFPAKILDADEVPVYQKAYNAGTAGDPAVPIRSIDGPVAPTPVSISFASVDEQTIIAAPGVGNRIRICSLFFSSTTNVMVSLKTGSDTIGIVYGEAFAKDWIHPLKLDANEAFVMQSTTTDPIYGQVCYWIESIDNM